MAEAVNDSPGKQEDQVPPLSPTQRRHSSTHTTPSGSPLLHATNPLYTTSMDYLPLEKVTFFDLLDPMSTIQNTTSTISKKYNKVKKQGISTYNKLKVETSNKGKKYYLELKDTEALRKKLNERVEKFDKRLSRVFYASEFEKLFYSAAIYFLFAGGFILGHYPEYFHVFYTALVVTLMPIRFYTYWKRSYQYFLADLCYYVNGLLCAFIWLAPQSQHLFIVCFAFTFGTLSWAVVTWRNSLVLHSVDKFTSSFIHVTPPVVVFVITHMLTEEYKLERFPGAAKVTRWHFFSGLLWTSLYYLIWQSAYHYFITLKRAAKIKAGRATSFEWLRKSFANTILGRFVNSLPDPFPVVAFTFIQYGYQLLTMSICPIWFRFKYLAALFLTFIFFVASYNGATYYVDYYGKKMEKEVQRLRAEIAEMQASSESTFEDSSESLLEYAKTK